MLPLSPFLNFVGDSGKVGPTKQDQQWDKESREKEVRDAAGEHVEPAAIAEVTLSGHNQTREEDRLSWPREGRWQGPAPARYHQAYAYTTTTTFSYAGV